MHRSLFRTRFWRQLGRITFLSLLLLAGLQAAPGATLRWTGGHATSSDWSRGANWDGGAAPANGDTLVFRTAAGVARLVNNNDLTGLQIAQIRFEGNTAGFALSGNGLSVTDGIAANHVGGANIIALARVTLANNLSMTVLQLATTLVIESEVRLNGNDLTVDSTGFLVISGVISGNGSVRKIGPSLFTLSGAAANTFSGDVFVNAGTLYMGKSAGLAVPNRLVIGDGTGGSHADIAFNLNDSQVNQVVVNSSGLWTIGTATDEVSSLVLNEGGDVSTDVSGLLRLGAGAGIQVNPVSGPNPDLSEISGTLELANGTHVVQVGENTGANLDPSELTISADISGTLLAGLTKEGAGDLLLSGDNSFLGEVLVNAGELRVGSALALGGTGNVGITSVNNDASLRLLASVEVSQETLRLNSTGTTSPGDGDPALRGTGECAWNGPIVLQRTARIGVQPGGLLTLDGVISGTGHLLKENTGTLNIGGPAHNTFNGDVLVNAGTVELDKGTIGGVIAVPGRLIVGDGIGGEHADVAIHRKPNQVGTVTVNASGFWNLGLFEDEVSDLVLNGGGDVATDPTGLLRLGIGANVDVNPGTSPDTEQSTISGRLELMLGQHRFTVDNGSFFPVDSELRIEASISGPGAILKDGIDKLNLVSANTYAGTLTVDQGELNAYHLQAFGTSTAGIRLNNSSVLRLVFSGTIVSKPLTLNSTGLHASNPTALIAAGNVIWPGDITLLENAEIDTGSVGSLELSGVISGPGGLTIDGEGPVTLSGNSANSYAGTTLVSEGRLLLNKSGILVAVPGTLIVGDGVGGANADVVECLGVNEIGALSAVTVSSSGRLVARQESIGSLRGSGQIEVTSSLNVGDDNTSTTFDGVIGGTGAFNKRGTGTLTFNGNNTYAAGTGIADGTLLVNGQQPAGFILLQPAGTLGGSGRAGNVSTFAGGATVSPGSSPGRLTTGNLLFGLGTVCRFELNGPTPATQHDQLRVLGTVDLGGATLAAALSFVPTLGQPIVLIDNDGADAVLDGFDGLQEGDAVRLNQIPFVISYQGGDGNDVTLTASARSVSIVSTRVQAGNGNGVIDPNECNDFYVALMNDTGGALAVSRVVLDTLTPGVSVTQQKGDYAAFVALDIRTNRAPFQIRTASTFPCGQPIDFLLTVTVSGGGATFTIPFSVPTGGAGVPVAYNSSANLNLADQATTIATLPVAGANPIVGKLAVSLHLTHPSAGDLILRLRSPAGTVVRLAAQRGGTTDNYGSDCANARRTIFDDDAAVKIAAGPAPFVGEFAPEEPLAAFLGEDPNGDWELLISDAVAGDTGVLRCWALHLSPPDCESGSGLCESCTPMLAGRMTPDLPGTTTRLVRDGIASSCGNSKICPGSVTGPRLTYQVHLLENTGPATCLTVVLNDLCRTAPVPLHIAAYRTSFTPADPCAGYLGDTGGDLASGADHLSFEAPAGSVIALVVSAPSTLTGCTDYALHVYGLACPSPTLSIAPTGQPKEVRLFWSTAYPGFDLQRAATLDGAAPYEFDLVSGAPIVVNGNYTVTNNAIAPKAFFRLRKP